MTTDAPASLSLWKSLPRAWREDDGTRIVDAVRAASTATVTATFTTGPTGHGRLTSAPSSLGGVSVAVNDRVLVRTHANPVANGIYAVTASGIWDRASDMVGAALPAGLATAVTEGTLAGTLWRVEGSEPRDVDVDAITFAEVDPSTLSVMEALVRALDTELGATYEEIAALPTAHNPYTCEARFLPEIAAGLGWKLDARMPESVQRKLCALLVILYRRKGTRAGIAAFVRLLTGSEVRVRAVRASGWRLGHSRLGMRVRTFTAAGFETELDITNIVPPATTPEGQYRAETFGELVVLRNGTRLTRADVRQPTPTSVQFVRGVRRVVRVGEQTISLGFNLTAGLVEVEAFVNGEPVPVDFMTWSASTPDEVGFRAPYTFITGDEVIVRSVSQTVALAPGDVVVVKVPPADRTRLASTLPRPWPASPTPDDLAAYDRARTLFIEVARRLVTGSGIDEPATVGAAVGVMASSKARPVLTAPHTEPRPRWVLGRSMLGRDTRV